MKKIYWEGNSAKSVVISNILSQTRTKRQKSFLVFDYGCGDGGDWHNVLADNSNIKLICFDPNKKSIMIAKKKLSKYDVTFLDQAELITNKFKSHFIISFSVLEHVYNKKKYLSIVKEHLRDDGTFFLNYDDGHFRNFLDLTKPSKWFKPIKEWIHNLLAYPLAMVGIESKFQKRIDYDYINNLIEENGFKIIDSFYSNLHCFKGLFKNIPEETKEEFTQFWIEVEYKLNNKFVYINKDKKYWGDYSNLWQFMFSRTLILKLK